MFADVGNDISLDEGLMGSGGGDSVGIELIVAQEEPHTGAHGERLPGRVRGQLVGGHHGCWVEMRV